MSFLNRLIGRDTAPRLIVSVISFLSCALFLGSCTTTSTGSAESVDYSHYDQPLGDQVVNRIKAKVMARLGEGRNDHDRYFIIPFAFQNRGNEAKSSHSFISVIRVFGDARQRQKNPGLITGTYKGREFEAFTISWLPHDFPENPHLCVFDGFGGMLIPSLNHCPLSDGKSFDLATTLKFAVGAKVVVGMWGPYEISEPGFDLGVKRLRLLETGTIKYRADDRGYRKSKVAVNCYHAMAGLDELFPNGGFLDTGFKMWGINGTKQVLREYTTKANRKQLLLEPVDIDHDVVGFVFAPEINAGDVFNPFKKGASAYHR